MQKKSRQSRKNPCIIIQNGQNVDPMETSLLCDEENSAKNMLFQLAEHDCSPIDEKTLKLNEWFKTEARSLKQQCGTPVKQSKYMRRTVHIRPFAEIKLLNQSYQPEENMEESIIPHLKLQLRKLESPEKRRQFQQKKRKLEYLQQKMKRKNDLVLVEELIQNKRHSIRVKKTLSEKKSNPPSFFHSFPETKTKPLMLIERNNESKSSSEQIFMIKQARRNRTLKNLLF